MTNDIMTLDERFLDSVGGGSGIAPRQGPQTINALLAGIGTPQNGALGVPESFKVGDISGARNQAIDAQSVAAQEAMKQILAGRSRLG